MVADIRSLTLYGQKIHTYSLMGSRIRDSAAASATLGFMLKKEQEKVIVAFAQGHDVLSTGFGKSLC